MITAKEECKEEFEKGSLEMSEDKCKSCEHYYECQFMLMAMNDVVYGED